MDIEENSYTVMILSNEVNCGEYTVMAPTVGKAQTRAMIQMFAQIDKGVTIPFVSGSKVTYAVRQNA